MRLRCEDFDAATQAIANDTSVKGIVLTSGKGVFIVGADITEFGGLVRRRARRRSSGT